MAGKAITSPSRVSCYARSHRECYDGRGQESSPSPSAEDLQGPKAPRTVTLVDKSILALT
jgi:hypothetical protein